VRLLQLLPLVNERGDEGVGLNDGGIERGPRPFVEAEFVSGGKYPARDARASRVRLAHHVGRVVGLDRVALGRGQERGRVAILKEAGRRVDELREFVEFMIALPLGLWAAAVERLRPVEFRRAARDGGVVDVENIS